MISLRLGRTGRAARIGAAGILALGLAATLGIGPASAAAGSAAAKAGCSGPTVSQQPFGSAFDLYAGHNLPVSRYTLANCHGMQVKILTYGGIIQSIQVPGRGGREADVVLGFKTLQDYVNLDSPAVTANGGPYFGETIGRYGNRIAKGTFTLDGKTYTLPINNGVNSLHGGLVGFGNHVWAATAVHSAGAAGVQLKLVSPNGDDGANVGCTTCTGYPGQLTVFVTFTLNKASQLLIHYRAATTQDTVLNLTNHSYFNLAGEASGATYGQKVQINASSYTPTDATQIPTGVIAPVRGTPFDFTRPETIGSRINSDNQQLLIAQGYDHNWVLRKTGPKAAGLRLAARAWDPASGRELTVWTDQPGVQFYSGNFLTGTLVGISGHIYRQSAGYTFETQHYPNSPNQPNFPSTELKPGQVFSSSTIFQFSA
jgi:aldose 1-epimerase